MHWATFLRKFCENVCEAASEIDNSTVFSWFFFSKHYSEKNTEKNIFCTQFINNASDETETNTFLDALNFNKSIVGLGCCCCLFSMQKILMELKSFVKIMFNNEPLFTFNCIKRLKLKLFDERCIRYSPKTKFSLQISN